MAVISPYSLPCSQGPECLPFQPLQVHRASCPSRNLHTSPFLLIHWRSSSSASLCLILFTTPAPSLICPGFWNLGFLGQSAHSECLLPPSPALPVPGWSTISCYHAHSACWIHFPQFSCSREDFSYIAGHKAGRASET